MGTAIFWIAVVLASLTGLAALGWAFHRLCLYLEDRGYLYYRTKPEGGGGLPGAFMEVDRLVRPSIQHTVDVEHEAKISDQDNIGGE